MKLWLDLIVAFGSKGKTQQAETLFTSLQKLSEAFINLIFQVSLYKSRLKAFNGCNLGCNVIFISMIHKAENMVIKFFYYFPRKTQLTTCPTFSTPEQCLKLRLKQRLRL